ncbi:accessory gene regulator B [Mobilisporobacter senegalensis]|uniref:Accessory gene regulator B n=1 Tax=Mobilisporobacter senegalensis TaxID=1329262 RepID=A0A3N1XF07_9FIRM|nr:accessory gene regulator B family protein [Mobilisporobacter senegalensis]ROR25255.1 accessory gene regulator B [Mobilisporobacter senegalensis]
MFSKLSGNIAEQLIENGTVDVENKEIYVYGIEQLFILIMNIVTTLIIGLCFGMLWQSIIFMLIYLPLRSFAGGYHASTVLRCYVVGIILSVIFLSINKCIPDASTIIIAMTVIASLIILLLAPVETSNKPLDQLELSMYKKRTRIILLSDICIITILLAFDLNSIALCIGVALMVLSFMVVLGKRINSKIIN